MSNAGRVYPLDDSTRVSVSITGRLNVVETTWGEAKTKFVAPFQTDGAEAACAQVLAEGRPCTLSLNSSPPLELTIKRA